MMLVKEFIYERLQSLSEQFHSVEMKYAYNTLARTHIVELNPLNAYYNDPALENQWIDIVKDFMRSYPAEDISFISADSTLRIDKPEFEFNVYGHRHVHVPMLKWSELENVWINSFNDIALNIRFEDIVLPQTLKSFISLEELRTWSSPNYFQFTHAEFTVGNFLRFSFAEDLGPITRLAQASTLPDSSDYAMAA